VADARTFDLRRRYPFSYMIGNAFQFFHTRADQEALLARVREHLQPAGCFLFETRNPSPRNLSEAASSGPREYATPDGGRLLIADERPVYDPMTQIQHRTSRYQWRWSDGRRVETTKRTALRYVYPLEIEALLHYNGFAIRARYGTWQGDPLTADSPEMIVVGQRRE
jgi:hypothetical protein